MLKWAAGMVVVGVMTGCGGGSDDGAPAAPVAAAWTGAVNSAGFPVIAGKYSFNTEKIAYTCTDGSAGTGGAIALNFILEQTDNAFTTESASIGAGSIPGMTIVSKGANVSNVKKDGSFISGQINTVKFDAIDGTSTVIYNLDGAFKPGQWSGNYEYTITFPALSASCKYKTTFTGDKITNSASAKPQSSEESGWYDENYVSVIGRRAGIAVAQ